MMKNSQLIEAFNELLKELLRIQKSGPPYLSNGICEISRELAFDHKITLKEREAIIELIREKAEDQAVLWDYKGNTTYFKNQFLWPFGDIDSRIQWVQLQILILGYNKRTFKSKHLLIFVAVFISLFILACYSITKI